MTLAIATMPDDPQARSRWLDEQLVGDRLGDLVDELMALGQPQTARGSLAELIGKYRKELLARGTGALPEPMRRQVLQAPDYLLELQELVLLEGGPYWNSLPRPNRLTNIVERSRAAILAQIPPPFADPEPIHTAGRHRGRGILQWIIPFAVAASVVLVLWGAGWWWPQWSASPEGAVAWGWAKPGALPQTASADDYYATLAAGGQQWFATRPDDRVSLARRLSELRQGCSILIISDHPPLSAEQSRELKDRCRKWAGQFDAALAKLEAGEDPIQVRTEVDATVEKLVGYLNSQRHV